MSGIGTRLDSLRTDATRRRLLTAVAVFVGLALAWVHWVGFLVGGALVALPQRSLHRGLLAALGLGLLALGGFLGWLGVTGALDTYLRMGQVLAVSAVAPPALSLLGGLVRGLR